LILRHKRGILAAYENTSQQNIFQENSEGI